MPLTEIQKLANQELAKKCVGFAYIVKIFDHIPDPHFITFRSWSFFYQQSDENKNLYLKQFGIEWNIKYNCGHCKFCDEPKRFCKFHQIFIDEIYHRICNEYQQEEKQIATHK